MQKRIIVSILLSIFVILAGLGLISHLRVRDSIRRSAEDRLALANIIGTFVDHIIEENLTRLYDISLSDKIDFSDGDWGPSGPYSGRPMNTPFLPTVFFFSAKNGTMALTYPDREGTRVNLRHIRRGQSAFRNEARRFWRAYHGAHEEKSHFRPRAAQGPQRRGRGCCRGRSTRRPMCSRGSSSPSPRAPRPISSLWTASAWSLPSNKPGNILTRGDHNKFLATLIAEKKSTVGTCHRCHEGEQETASRTEDIIAFAPLGLAPWGVRAAAGKNRLLAVDEIEKGLFHARPHFPYHGVRAGPRHEQEHREAHPGADGCADRIARGDLSAPVDVIGTDEIAVLARSFEVMRHRLADSLQSIQLYSVGLEQRVRDRTKQLEEKQVANKAPSRRSSPRRRTSAGASRGTSRRIAPGPVGSSCGSRCASFIPSRCPPKSGGDEEHRNGHHQRNEQAGPEPEAHGADDLGFEASIVWLLDRNLKEKRIMCFLNMDAFFGRRAHAGTGDHALPHHPGGVHEHCEAFGGDERLRLHQNR